MGFLVITSNHKAQYLNKGFFQVELYLPSVFSFHSKFLGAICAWCEKEYVWYVILVIFENFDQLRIPKKFSIIQFDSECRCIFDAVAGYE